MVGATFNILDDDDVMAETDIVGSTTRFRNRRLLLLEFDDNDDDEIFGVVETKTKYSDFSPSDAMPPVLRVGLNSIDDGPDKPAETKEERE